MALRFSAITEPSELDSLTQFLAAGFSWSESERFRIKNSILKYNAEFGSYGAAAWDSDGKPVIAILFYYQGTIQVPQGAKSVVNLSAWYTAPSYRGLESIRFAKNLTDFLRSCVITSYTVGDELVDIWFRLGFRFQQVIRVRRYPWTVKKGDPLLSSEVCADTLQYLSGFACNGKMKRTKYSVSGVELSVIYRVHRVRRLRIPLRVVDIVWTDNFPALNQELGEISRNLMWNVKAVAVNTFLKIEGERTRAPWILFSEDKGVTFVSPAQSELTCI
jgi:hypothetical protein